MNTIIYGTDEYYLYLVRSWVREPQVQRMMIEAERSENQNNETSFALEAGIPVAVLIREYIEAGVECDDVDPVEARHYLRIPQGALPDEFAAEDVNTAEVPHENIGPLS